MHSGKCKWAWSKRSAENRRWSPITASAAERDVAPSARFRSAHCSPIPDSANALAHRTGTHRREHDFRSARPVAAPRMATRLRERVRGRCRVFVALIAAVFLSVVDPATAQLTPLAQGDSRVLLQADGSSELIEQFHLDLPDAVTSNDIEFFQTSTNEDTLSVETDRNIIPTQSGDSLNVSCTLSFDRLPGVTRYTLGVRRKQVTAGTEIKEVLYERSISYTVVGMSMYTIRPDGTKNIVSGDSNVGFKIPYTNTTGPQVDPNDRIYTVIQYSDGTDSKNLPQSAQRIPLGATLVPKIESMLRQFDHDPERCNFDIIGSYSSTDGVTLPVGCGFGFYRDAPGNLLFGFKWNPYRVGPLRLHFSWPGLTAVSSDLAEESYETTVKAEVTGNPPIAVSKVTPSDQPFRTEGGLPVEVTFFNGNEQPISDMRIQIAPGTFAKLVPGTISPIKQPERTQTATFIVEPGAGGPYDATVQFKGPQAVTPGTPITPGTPGTPTTPGTPGTPGTSSTPGTPGTPTTSGTPGTPGTPSTPSTPTEPWVDAIMEVPFKPTYDDKPLFIESMTPTSGNEEGGTPITLTGYFSNFDPTRDSVEFSGMKIPQSNFETTSSEKVIFKLPSKKDLGDSLEYEVVVMVGNGISNRLRFSFSSETTEEDIEIQQTGTSSSGNGRYRVSACTPIRFTAVSKQASKVVKKVEWGLASTTAPGTDLFKTKPELKDFDTTTETIVLQPSQLGEPGSYILSVTITLENGNTVKKNLVLVKDNEPAPGVFILDNPPRTMFSPRAPVRLVSVVTSPGSCYSGDQTIRYEWEVFENTYTFSPSQATGDASIPPEGIFTGRLGRELVIPQTELKPGKHNATLKVWLGNKTEPSGIGTTTFEVISEDLISIIRNGEQTIETNWVTNLDIFGTKSYDPNVLDNTRNNGLSFKWSCEMSNQANFANPVGCPSGALPSAVTTAPAFTVNKEDIRSLGSSVKYLRYTLEVTKDTRRKTTSIDVTVMPGGTKPKLMDFSLDFTDVDGNSLVPAKIPTFETVLLDTVAPAGTTWSYQIASPVMEDVQFFQLLEKSDVLYSPEKKATNTNPLGFAAGKLSAFTPYTMIIEFSETVTAEATRVVYPFKTAATPRFGDLKPSPFTGDTTQWFTVNPGVPVTNDDFSYYYYITDSEGNEVCVGGCTGHPNGYFRISLPGTYTFSGRLYNKRGSALIDTKVDPKPLELKPSGKEKDVIKSLALSFKTGDDSNWVQVAQDLTIAASEENPSKEAIEMLFGRSYEDLQSSGLVTQSTDIGTVGVTPEPSPETNTPMIRGGASEKYTQQRNAARALAASGMRKIVCSTSPNAQMGRSAMLMVLRVLRSPFVSPDTLYDVLFISTCSIDKAIPTDGVDVEDILPEILGLLYKHAENLDKRGLARTRIRSRAGPTGSLAVDAAIIVGRLMVRAFGVGKLDGTHIQKDLGTNGTYGSVTVFTGSSASQMPTVSLSGKPRHVLQGRTKDELFYIDEARYATIFTSPRGGASSKRYLVLHETPDFVVNSNLQDNLPGGNLGKSIYWTQAYGRTSSGALERLEPKSAEPAYCIRMPIDENRKHLMTSVQRMPGMYAHKDMKPLGVAAARKGEYFNYDISNIKVILFEVKPESGWVEACHVKLSLFGVTSVTREEQQAQQRAIGLQNSALSGENGFKNILIVLLVIAALIVVFFVAILIHTRSRSRKAAYTNPDAAYTDRDATGRAASAAAAGAAPPAPASTAAPLT